MHTLYVITHYHLQSYSLHTFIHTMLHITYYMYTYKYTYTYAHMCVCVCVSDYHMCV